MAESWATLWSYRLHDLLMFSATTYYRLFEAINRQWWPAPLVGVVLAAAVVVCVMQASRRHQTAARPGWPAATSRWAGLLLALCWAAVALLYFRGGFAAIHWLGSAWMVAFVLQALACMAWAAGPANGAAAAAGGLTAGRGPRRVPRYVLGFALMGAATCWPALTQLLQRPLWQAEVVGLAPDATVLLTLGVLISLAPPRRWAAALLPVPLAWCVFSGATLWALAQPHALVLPLAGAWAAVGLLRWRR